MAVESDGATGRRQVFTLRTHIVSAHTTKPEQSPASCSEIPATTVGLGAEKPRLEDVPTTLAGRGGRGS